MRRKKSWMESPNKLILIPCETARKEHQLYLNDGKLSISGTEGEGIPHHLYLFNDDVKVGKGDYFIKENWSKKAKKSYPKLHKENGTAFCNTKWVNSKEVEDCHKVIASTDPSLGLPLIEKRFVEDFTKLYNNGCSFEFTEVVLKNGIYTLPYSASKMATNDKERAKLEGIVFFTYFLLDVD